MIVQNFGQRAE